MAQGPKTPKSSRFSFISEDGFPVIHSDAPFAEVVSKVSDYIAHTIDAAYTYEQIRTTVAGQGIRLLVQELSENCFHPALVPAFLCAKYEFQQLEDDGMGLSESRGFACEIAAYQFLTFLSEKELIDHLLYELPKVSESSSHNAASSTTQLETSQEEQEYAADEFSRLLPRDDRQDRPNVRSPLRPPRGNGFTSADGSESAPSPVDGDELVSSMSGMNALEIAGVANAKKFLSQRLVQTIVDDIWNGNVIFWESLSVEAVKKPRAYNKRVADPFTRLRVPKYQKAFQVAFFASFLALYYAVLVERNPERITITEILLYVWIASYAYDEFGEIRDAGVLFYRVDFWSLWDVAIIGVGVAFIITRAIGLVRNNAYVIDMSFDILSMVALFLVPRICSVMSLNPYFGSLIPVLKEMTKTFCNFLPVIFILYLGFLTTFTMLARDRLTLNEMSWILIKVFFGSSYLGFDVAVTISPALGYPLMLIFVTLTNILLLTALVSLVSNSLIEVMAHAREEYLFQYSIYVLESSTSRRLTYFMPPLNLVPLLLLRPLRLVLPSGTIRRIRIVLLKATHVQFVALIWAYEGSRRLVSRGSKPPTAKSSRATQTTPRPLSVNTHGLDRETARPSAKNALDKATHHRTSNDSAVNAGETDLVALVQRLSSQVEDLTAMVAAQQKD